MAETRQFLESFQGPKGTAEVFEVVEERSGRLGVEEVTYEVLFQGERHVVQTMGEASILACQLSGDDRFSVNLMRP